MGAFDNDRRRRLGGVLPSSIANLALWLRADDATLSALSDNTAVATWTDQSGAGRNATQGTGAAQPKYRTNVVGGKPVLRFDGVDDFMNTANFSLAQPEHIFVVCNPINIAASARFLDGTSGGNTMSVANESGSPSNRLDMNAGSLGVTLTGYTSAFHVFNFLFNNASSVGRWDGANSSSGTCGANNPGGVAICNFAGGGTNVAGVDIAELIIFSRSLSSAEQTQMERYLGGKYGITVA